MAEGHIFVRIVRSEWTEVYLCRTLNGGLDEFLEATLELQGHSRGSNRDLDGDINPFISDNRANSGICV